MNILSLLGGALTLRTETFATLRERSDVFYRGSLVMLFIALMMSAFAAGVPLLHPATEAQVTAEALRGFMQSYNGPAAMQGMIEAYIREGIAIGFEIHQLPPNAGAAFGPIARFLEWLGAVLTTPWSGGVLGYLLLAGLLVHLTSRWLGGRAGMAQMLGLSALSYAPQIFYPVSSLLTLGGTLTGAGAFGALNSLVGLAIFVWSTIIYIKATALAQGFTYGRAIGAILLALLLVIGASVLLACLGGALIAGAISARVSATR